MDDHNQHPDRIPPLADQLARLEPTHGDFSLIQVPIHPADLTWPHHAIDELLSAILERSPGSVLPTINALHDPKPTPLRCRSCRHLPHGLDACHRPEIDPHAVCFVCRSCRRILAWIPSAIPPDSPDSSGELSGPPASTPAHEAPPGPTGGAPDPDSLSAGSELQNTPKQGGKP